MESQVGKLSLSIHYPPLSPTSSICSERSTPSPDSGLECPPSQSSESNFLHLKTEEHVAKRKISTSSEASYGSVNLSYDGGFSEGQLSSDDLTSSSNKYDDIIEKIDGLKFSPSNSNSNLNEPEITVRFVDKIIKQEQQTDDEGEDDDDDDDLQERGPENIKGKSLRKKPYETDHWFMLPTTTATTTTTTSSIERQVFSPELELKAQEILSDKQYGHVIKNCIDRLTDYQDGQRIGLNNDWGNGTDDNSLSNETSIPSIILQESSLMNEEQLLNFLGQQKFQAAQLDTSNNQNPSPAASSEHWPDSPASSGNNVLSSRSHSRASSRAQSPGSIANLGSPLIPISIASSPPQHRLTQFRQPRPQSTSSSSNYSFSDTPSPSNYVNSIDSRSEDLLGLQFDHFRTNDNFESSSTIVNSSDNIDDLRLHQLMNEVTRDNFKQDEMQVVPKYQNDHICHRNNDKCSQNLGQDYSNNLSNLANTGTLINTAQNNLLYDDSYYGLDQSYSSNMQESAINGECLTSEAVLDIDAELADILGYSSRNTTESSHIFTDRSPHLYNNIEQSNIAQLSSTQVSFEVEYSNFGQPSASTSDGFIPTTVSQQTQHRVNNSRRNSFKKPSLWNSLNLPNVPASETLKAHVDPKEVERAMKIVLQQSNEYLTKGDEDGYTKLMCLVSNPDELEMNKAYLVPLVERLGQIPDGLSRMNNRGEDALYLAAMNCPQMSYIAGYLAAVMLQKGIDISHRLYHTRGDTLIHAIAMQGETHKSVLAQLLLLKTVQGNSVFDLSKCNYDGRTPLHVAVESHDPLGSGTNSTSIVRLLLENGADAKVKETECGNTALHLAISLSSDPSLIRALLMKKGSDAVNVLNRNNETPLLMIASTSKRINRDIQADICTILIETGGTTNIAE